MTTESTKYNTSIYGSVQNVIIGDNGTMTVISISGEQLTVPFLAPRLPNWELVGRDEILSKLKKRLFPGGKLALSALNGLPGVGKTALAVALAHDQELLSNFPDGVLWAGLGREADVMALLGRWGTVLGIDKNKIPKLTTVSTRAEEIRAAIGMRRMLLVIDDAWESEAALSLQVGGPNCAHLLTTRQSSIALDFAGKSTTVTELNLADGLALLKQFAPAIVDAEPEAAQKLVADVGGLPLAIILMGRYLQKAAHSDNPRRIRDALSQLHDVEQRLLNEQPPAPAGHFPALSAGTSLSLLAAIAMSDEALDKPARRAFYALSVFPSKPNTFSEEAALAVSAEPAEALDTLTDYGLLESSGKGRYTLHQAIADYAGVNLSDEVAFERMVTYFVNYVETHEKDYDVLEQETNNVLAALDVASERGIQIAVVQGTNVFYHFLEVRGLYGLAETHLKRAEQTARTLDDPIGLVTTLLNLGRIAVKRGNYSQAEMYLQEGLVLARKLGDRERISALLQNLGQVEWNCGRYASAEKYHQDGLVLARELKHSERICALLHNLGSGVFYRGAVDEAEAYWKESLALAQKMGYDERVSSLLPNLGVAAAKRGKYQEAEAYYKEGLKLARKIGQRDRICLILQNLGASLGKRGARKEAEKYFQEGLMLAREIGHRDRMCGLLENLGDVAFRSGVYDQAEVHYQEGLALARDMGNTEKIVRSIEKMGDLAVQRGAYEQAKMHYQGGLNLAREIGHRELISSLLNSLGALEVKCKAYDQAKKYLQKSLRLAQEIGEPWLTSAIIVGWGKLHLKQQHRWDLAALAFREALEIAQKANLQDFIAEALYGLAQVAFVQGDIAKARQQGQESLAIFEKTGHKNGAEVKEWLAKLDVQPEE